MTQRDVGARGGGAGPTGPPGFSRRVFLALLGAAAGVLGLRIPPTGSAGTMRAPHAGGDDSGGGSAGPGPGAAEGRDALIALGYVLIPSSFGERQTAAGRAGLSAAAGEFFGAYLERAARSGEVARKNLRGAASFLDRESLAAFGLRFADLDRDRQCRLIDTLVKPFVRGSLLSTPYYYLTGRGREVRRLWNSVARPLLVNFYASDLGWSVVGYSSRPGGCSDLVAYQFPPS